MQNNNVVEPKSICSSDNWLQLVEVGDAITVYLQSKPYQYFVTSTSLVPAIDLAVEAPTSTPRLTLYTCTPLWTAQNRLIVVAEPKGSKERKKGIAP